MLEVVKALKRVLFRIIWLGVIRSGIFCENLWERWFILGRHITCLSSTVVLIDGGVIDPDLELENDSDLRRFMVRILWAGSDNACLEGFFLRCLSNP